MNRIVLLKFLDRIFGVLLVFLLPRREARKKELKEIKRLLFIRPGGIGDAVLLLPAIREVKKAFPGALIDVLAEKRNAGIFGLSGDIHYIYLYDRGFGLFRCLGNSYDAVIDTEQWHRLSAVAAYFTKAPVCIGFDTNERRALLTHKIPYRHEDYEVYSFFHLVEPLLRVPPEFSIEVPFVSVDPDKSLHFLEGTVNKDDVVVAVFPGASVTERKWGGDKFGKVAAALSRHGYKVVIVGGGTDRSEADKIRVLAPEVIDLTGKTTLRETAAVLRRSRLLITADSGLMHLAVAVGTRTVCLFGSGIEKKWAPQGKDHLVINKRPECSPCTRFGYTPRCASGVACLSAITIEEVVAAAESSLR